MGWGSDLYSLVRIPIRKACKGYYLRWYYNGWHYWFFQPGTLTVVTEGEKYRTIGTRKINMGSGQLTRGQADAIRTIMNTREVYLLTLAGWMNIRIEPGTLNVYNNQVAGAELEFTAVIGSREISYTDGYTPVPLVPSVESDPYVPGSCEIVIGTQIWMCKNYDTNYPGSKVYNNDEANRAIYGGLYTFVMIKSPGFCPVGWHVPTLAEWQTLIDYVGGETIAGRELKEVGESHWGIGNVANDTHGFAALGAGMYSTEFIFLTEYAKFWTADKTFGGVYTIEMSYTDIATQTILELATYFQSVRLIKDTPAPAYCEVVIGTQTWMCKNVDNNLPGSFVYNNDEANRAIYGGLYDWSHVAIIETLYPGYHVPTYDEVLELATYLGGGLIAGKHMKEAGTDHWLPHVNAGDNSSGWTGLAGGVTFDGITYFFQKVYSYWWMSTEFSPTKARAFSLIYDSFICQTSYTEDKIGSYFSIRLIKD